MTFLSEEVKRVLMTVSNFAGRSHAFLRSFVRDIREVILLDEQRDRSVAQIANELVAIITKERSHMNIKAGPAP